MPFQSESQRRFLWMHHPKIARKWAHEFPGQGPKNLPAHVSQGKSKGHKSKRSLGTTR